MNRSFILPICIGARRFTRKVNLSDGIINIQVRVEYENWFSKKLRSYTDHVHIRRGGKMYT